jgi:hypothetical protein
MKKNRTILLKRTWVYIVKGSTRGCGLRYILNGETPDGESMRMETNPCSESNWTCDLHNNGARFFRVAVREVGVMTPIADKWETSVTSGVDLEAEFQREKADAANKEQQNG